MLKMSIAIAFCLSLPLPTQETRHGLQSGDAGVLLPRLSEATRNDPSWCGEFVVHLPTRGPVHMVTLRFVILGEDNQLETITLDHDLVRPNLDKQVVDRPLVKLVQMSDTTSAWIDIWMNQKQLDEATCLKKK